MNKYGLIGGKLGHSFSPIIHQFIHEEMGIESSYELLECKEEDLVKVIDRLKNGEFTGLNVTIPYKQTIMKYLDVISDEATKIGAVNTVCIKDGKICGYNTDYFGFKMELEVKGVDVKRKNVYLLGCGGAAKAVYQALLDLEAIVHVAIRREDLEMSRSFNNVIFLDELDDCDIDVIVNTTPVGMYPNIDACVIKEEICKKASVVIDVIYNPLKTKLLSYAKKGFNGLYMLVLQAVKSNEIFHETKVNNIEHIYDKVLNEVIK